jgi:hypothetical protein
MTWSVATGLMVSGPAVLVIDRWPTLAKKSSGAEPVQGLLGRTSQGAQARPCIGLSGVVLIVARGRVYDVTTTSTDIPAKASAIPTKVPDTGLAC